VGDRQRYHGKTSAWEHGYLSGRTGGVARIGQGISGGGGQPGMVACGDAIGVVRQAWWRCIMNNAEKTRSIEDRRAKSGGQRTMSNIIRQKSDGISKGRTRR